MGQEDRLDLAGDTHEDGVDKSRGDGHGLQSVQGGLATGHQEGGGGQTWG